MVDTSRDDVLAIVDTYPALAKALADRRRELGMSQLDVDHVAGTQSGYCGKVECGMRHLGTTSLPSILGALGLRIALVRDVPHAVKQGRLA